MPRPLSNDLRERIVKAVNGGLSRNATARKLDVSISAVVKLVQRWQATGSHEPIPTGGQRPYALAEHEERVKKLLEVKPDMTVAEMQKRLASDKIKVSPSSISRFLKHLDLSYKKNSTRQRARSA